MFTLFDKYGKEHQFEHKVDYNEALASVDANGGKYWFIDNPKKAQRPAPKPRTRTGKPKE